MANEGAQRSTNRRKQSRKPFSNQQKLNERITKFLSLPEPIFPVKFVFLRLGSLCNASESNSFTSARCNIEHIKNDQNKLYSLDLRTLFDQGFNTLRKYKLQNNSQQLHPNETAAIRRLECFFHDEGKGFFTDITFTFTLKIAEIHVQLSQNQCNHVILNAFVALKFIAYNKQSNMLRRVCITFI